jgi:uncharacterized phage-associated protein
VTDPKRGFDGRVVANFVLDFCAENELRITNLALQKIVYFCHVWSLVKLGRPLVAHDFEAWEFGPVLPYLYREFKRFDANPISSRATSLDIATGHRRFADKSQLDPETKLLITDITNFYARLSASELVKLSHVSEGPWHRVWHHDGKVNPGMKIDNDAILAYYSRTPSSTTIQ